MAAVDACVSFCVTPLSLLYVVRFSSTKYCLLAWWWVDSELERTRRGKRWNGFYGTRIFIFDYRNPPLLRIEIQINCIEITASCDLVFCNVLGANQLFAHKMDEPGSSGMLERKMSLYSWDLSKQFTPVPGILWLFYTAVPAERLMYRQWHMQCQWNVRGCIPLIQRKLTNVLKPEGQVGST